MNRTRRFSAGCALIGLLLFGASPTFCSDYPWLQTLDPGNALSQRISLPPGFERLPAPPDSFQEWLRHLPLKPGNPPVHLFDGTLKANQDAQFAVVDLDVGRRDLQQCADAIIRLRAEYLYARHRYDAIHFNFSNGETAFFGKWIEGFRPVLSGRKVLWKRSARTDDSHFSLMSYLQTVFTYAGTASLDRELRPVSDVHDIRAGDVFIQGGFPGHGVIVVDVAENRATGRRIFALAQSYMPAQDMHVLRNPALHSASPWYETDFGEILRTPEWTFRKSHLKRFP